VKNTPGARVFAVAVSLALGAVLTLPLAFDRADELEPRPQGAPPPPRRAYAKGQAHRLERLPGALELAKAVARPKRAPRKGEWLAAHPEGGQLLAEFLAERPDGGWPPGRTIYLVPVGELMAAQNALLSRTAAVLTAWYQTDVKVLPALSDSVVPAASRRQRDFGMQWQTAPILDALVPLRPPDAAGLMAVTAVDLYPDEDWNFVFGEARYGERVGVMSVFRHGDLATEPTTVLARTASTAAHELGHMVGLLHCVAFECAMNGSNSLEESDGIPLEPCPACLAKLSLRLEFDPIRRALAMEAVCLDAGLANDVAPAIALLRDAGLLNP
jgi:archaemetzincin